MLFGYETVPINGVVMPIPETIFAAVIKIFLTVHGH
jgi:hypothetical protein